MTATMLADNPRICVIGLGYVGLPLAIALARHFEVVGFDISTSRVADLQRHVDRTGEVEQAALAASTLTITNREADITGYDIYIVTVPTPVNQANRPDLTAVQSACQTAGRVLQTGAIVVLESTVYPGVTEDLCGPAIEQASGLTAGRDFFLGYSPERINPGDREHRVDTIAKVVSGQTAEVAARLAGVYGKITSGGIFIARSIKIAEAAKVIENAQRDINIAFINEVTTIFNRLGISIYDVLDASRTKWNFLPFAPGLVGGHCIGVDPFYLADLAQRLGHDPQVILSGRRINDAMGGYIANGVAEAIGRLRPVRNARVLVLGLTFKENVPDLRNSKVVDVIDGLRAKGCQVDVHDPHADAAEAKAEYGIDLLRIIGRVEQPYDALILAVAHLAYRDWTPERIASLMKPTAVVADVKGVWRTVELPAGLHRWQL